MVTFIDPALKNGVIEILELSDFGTINFSIYDLSFIFTIFFENAENICNYNTKLKADSCGHIWQG